MSDKKRILFLGTGDSSRSQMAEGLLQYSAADKFEVFCAGPRPKAVHPLAMQVMKEIGIEISPQTSKDSSTSANKVFDYMISICDPGKEDCAISAGAGIIHWTFDNPTAAPQDEQLLVFRRVRDEIRQRINLFLLANSK